MCGGGGREREIEKERGFARFGERENRLVKTLFYAKSFSPQAPRVSMCVRVLRQLHVIVVYIYKIYVCDICIHIYTFEYIHVYYDIDMTTVHMYIL